MLVNKIDKHKVELAVNTLRMLSADAVEKAQSGHPGLPMGFADVAFVLWMQFLRFNPQNPKWPNRDRFILSAGHGSMLLYSLLNLFGYDMSLEDIKQFGNLEVKLLDILSMGIPMEWKLPQGLWGRGLPTVSVWRWRHN